MTSAPVITKLANARDLPYGISGESDEKCGKHGQNITYALRNVTESTVTKLNTCLNSFVNRPIRNFTETRQTV